MCMKEVMERKTEKKWKEQDALNYIESCTELYRDWKISESFAADLEIPRTIFVLSMWREPTERVLFLPIWQRY